MPSLFLRIFLSFWLAMTLIGATFTAIHMAYEPSWRIERGRYITAQALRLFGISAVEGYESQGSDAVSELAHELESRTHIRAYLIREGQIHGAETDSPEAVLEIGQSALEQDRLMEQRKGDVEYLAQPLVSERAARYAIVGELHHPSRWAMLLHPDTLLQRMLAMFVISGLVSVFLARYLSKPIRVLRRAARKLGEGDLSVRVGPLMGRRRDETAQLGRDFDHMADRIETLLEAQRRLLRDISHELRSPLARLNVALELARQKEGAEAQASLTRIERESTRLNELIDQILQVTRLESPLKETDLEPVDLTDLVKEIVTDADFEARNRDRGVTLVAADPVMVTGNEEVLRQGVENVVRNAVRYTAKDTTVEVSITCESRAGASPQKASANGALSRPSPRARILIRDYGPGVPENILQDIYRPFFRVGDARDRDSGGTGIGLAISERAIRLHGGTIQAANAERGGLLITIELPSTDSDSRTD